MIELPKILLTTYPDAFLFRAGGEFEMTSIVDILKKNGFIADLYGPYSRNIEHYDVVLHFSVNPNGLNLLKQIKNAGKKIILWPNFWTTHIENVSVDILNAFVEIADHIVFKSNTEMIHFAQLVTNIDKKAIIIPTIVDECFEKEVEKTLFSTLYGIEQYGIWLGVIEPNKNQLTVIKSLSNLDIPIVFVGGHRSLNYYSECRAIAPEHFYFIDSLPYRSDITVSALKNSLFYIETSLEPSGISALSAGIAGCNMILSDDDWNREHFHDLPTYVNPKSESDILRGVRFALDQQKCSEDYLKLNRYSYSNASSILIDFFSKLSNV